MRTMKTVEVRYFALYREQAGCPSERLDVAFDTAGDLFESVCGRHGLSAADGAKIAINDEIATHDTTLHNGDIVLIFPPVAGG